MRPIHRLHYLHATLIQLTKGKAHPVGHRSKRADGWYVKQGDGTWQKERTSLASRVREMHDHPDTHPEAKKVLAKLLGEHDARGEERPKSRGAGERARAPRTAVPQEAVDKALAVYEAVRDNVRRVEFSEIEDKLQPLRHMDRGVLFQALQQIGGRPRKSDTAEAHVAGFVKVLRRLKAQADEIDRI